MTLFVHLAGLAGALLLLAGVMVLVYLACGGSVARRRDAVEVIEPQAAPEPVTELLPQWLTRDAPDRTDTVAIPAQRHGGTQ